MNRRFITAAGLIICLLVIWLVQYSSPYIVGADGNLHARMALMIAKSGFLRSLPEAHFSWFAVRFSDKDFLYHLYLVPFVTILGYTAGTKLAAAVGFSLLAVSVYVVLKRLVSWPFTVLGMLVLAMSPKFLRDMSEARPFVFAVMFTVLGIDAVQRKSPKAVFLIGLLYGMTHLSAWVLPVYAVMYAVYGWISSGKLPYKVVLASVGGYALSFLLHPNFPNNVFYAYINGILVPWYAITGGVLELGAEFFPITTRDLATRYPAYILGGASVPLVLPYLRNSHRREIAGWGTATVIFALFGMVSQRNLTHLYPVAVIFLMIVAESSAKSMKEAPKLMADRLRSVLVPVLLAGLAVCGYLTLSIVRIMLLSDAYWSDHYTRVARYMEKSIPNGNRIFHTNWSDSQYLLGLAPQYEYIETLDPIYMYTYDKPLYELYRRVSFGSEKDPYSALTKSFGTYYGYAGKNYFNAFIEQIRKDSRFTIMAEDELGVVFSVKK